MDRVFGTYVHSRNIRYLKIFITILLITLIPILCITVIIQIYSTINTRDSYIRMKLGQLENIAVAMDEKMVNLDSLMKTLGNNQDVIQFTVSPEENNYSLNRRIVREMDTYASSNANIESIYIFSRSYGLLLSSKHGLQPLHEFEDTSWLDTLPTLQTGLPAVVTRNKSGMKNPTISSISSIPLRSRGAMGAIIFNLDERQFYASTFRHILPGSRQFIIDSSGTILSHPDPSAIGSNYWNSTGTAALFNGTSGSHFIEQDGEKILFSYAKGDYTKWYIVSEEDVSVILGPVRPFFLILMIIVIAAVMFILIADILLSRTLYRPYQNLRDIEGKFDEIQPMIEEKILNTILSGHVDRKRKLSHDLEKIGFDLSYAICAGIIIELDDYSILIEEMGHEKVALLKDEITEMLEIGFQDPYVENIRSEIRENRLALVVFFQTEQEFSQCKAQLSATVRTINAAHSYSITCAIGSSATDISNADMSLKDAETLLGNKFLRGHGKTFIYGETIPSNTSSSPAVEEVRKQFLHCIRLGDPQVTKDGVQALYRRILAENLSPVEARTIYTSVIHDIAGLIRQYNLDERKLVRYGDNCIDEFEKQETIEEATRWLSEISSDMTVALRTRDNDQIDTVAQSILTYIDENISNRNISLTEIGEAVGLSASYVSKVFKEYCGYNYLEYLNRNRITKAIQLLLNPHLSIEEIGSQVGFSSTQSFLRVFQKYQKTTPGKYRKTVIGAQPHER